jgi:hypothetical protein
VTTSDALGELLHRAAGGSFPPEDGRVAVVPRCPPGDRDWVVSFTAHAVVATRRSPDEVLAQEPDGYGGAVAPRFLLWLAGPGGTVGCQDALLVARGRGGGSLPARTDLEEHPRVRLARRLRQDVAVHGDARGFVTLGTGLAGITEMSVEAADPTVPGAGRELIVEALCLADAGRTVLAQVTPGNARSLRAFLAAGFVPIGSAVAVTPAAS